MAQSPECGDTPAGRLFVPLTVWFFVTLVTAVVATAVALAPPRWRSQWLPKRCGERAGGCCGWSIVNGGGGAAAAAGGLGDDGGGDDGGDGLGGGGGGVRDDGLVQESWRINFRELRFGRRIGVGNVGEVYRGTYKGQVVAIKKLLSTWVDDADMVERFRDEIVLMASMNHNNVLRFIGAVVDQHAGNICLVTELCERGTLHDVLRSDEPLSWQRRLKMARDVACGMDYLHTSLRIIQRDLKTANLLVTRSYDVKIAGAWRGAARLALALVLVRLRPHAYPVLRAPLRRLWAVARAACGRHEHVLRHTGDDGAGDRAARAVLGEGGRLLLRHYHVGAADARGAVPGGGRPRAGVRRGDAGPASAHSRVLPVGVGGRHGAVLGRRPRRAAVV